jgi:hypothetical protein
VAATNENEMIKVKMRPRRLAIMVFYASNTFNLFAFLIGLQFPVRPDPRRRYITYRHLVENDKRYPHKIKLPLPTGKSEAGIGVQFYPGGYNGGMDFPIAGSNITFLFCGFLFQTTF